MKIVVAMSGGVDSSVAAALLAEQGHDVIGLSMQLYDQSGPEAFGSCCSLDDLYDARRVASTLGFPHYIVNFERQFRETDAAALRALQQRLEVLNVAGSRARAGSGACGNRALRTCRAARRWSMAA